jgi:hypothetical protein
MYCDNNPPVFHSFTNQVHYFVRNLVDVKEQNIKILSYFALFKSGSLKYLIDQHEKGNLHMWTIIFLSTVTQNLDFYSFRSHCVFCCQICCQFPVTLKLSLSQRLATIWHFQIKKA